MGGYALTWPDPPRFTWIWVDLPRLGWIRLDCPSWGDMAAVRYGVSGGATAMGKITLPRPGRPHTEGD
jgi:hypothetical protein